MANILINVERGIEIGAEDLLQWLTGADKVLQATPAVVAALAILAAAAEKPLAELAGAAADPLNIPLDLQAAWDLKAVCPRSKLSCSPWASSSKAVPEFACLFGAVVRCGDGIFLAKMPRGNCASGTRQLCNRCNGAPHRYKTKEYSA